MKELLQQYDAWRAEGVGIGRAVVVRTFGSSPRQEGSVLLVTDDGRMIGSVSGGCVENAVAQEVLEARQTGRSRVIRYGISDEDAWGVGLACGGTIDVLVQPEVPEDAVEAARAEDRTDRAIAIELPDDAPPPTLDGGNGAGSGKGSERLDDARRSAMASGRSRTAVTDDGQVFIEAYPARPRLVIVGATEVTRWLVELAKDLGYERIVVDARPAFATKERFPDVERLIVAWPDEAFDEIDLGSNDAVAVLSHDPKFDEPAIVEAIRRGARYVGAVGSRKSQASRRERLLAAGLTEAQLSTLHGPIGLDLGGREPAETALSILAEIVAARRGGTGQPLATRQGRIVGAGA